MSDAKVRPIVGWMVHGAHPEHAAMFNVYEKEKAFDAAKRWNCSITALVAHSDTPDIAPAERALAAP